MSEEEIIKTLQVLIGLEEFNKLSYKENKAIQGLLDLYNKEKENKNIMLSDLLEREEELKIEKEKNKELENCLQMAKQIMTVDISEDFDCMKLKEFKEYLLNEMKLNENFEE